MSIYTKLIQFDWSYLMIIVNVIILYLIMKRFFFEKIRNFMQKRQDDIKDALDNADKVNADAEIMKKDYEKKLQNIEEEGRTIIKNSKIKAEEKAREIISQAEQKSDQMKKQTEAEIERQKRAAIEDMKDEIAALSILAAEKIIEKQLNIAEHQAVINKVLSEAGNIKWQN
ncbi:MAG: F0F1 ATP synthase subunit B [Eubacteriaceae bacterium]|nr:F0F1 ATP synthase subunit B [Eubacteriaceae bacterium]